MQAVVLVPAVVAAVTRGVHKGWCRSSNGTAATRRSKGKDFEISGNNCPLGLTGDQASRRQTRGEFAPHALQAE